MQPAQSSDRATDTGTPLVRGIGLGSAVALNMTDMIGVGPFITIPLIVMAMGGPQAMLGWILGLPVFLTNGTETHSRSLRTPITPRWPPPKDRQYSSTNSAMSLWVTA